MKHYYFGTDTSDAGHYFFELSASNMHSSRIGFNDLPFNPELFPVVKGGRYATAPRGITRFYKIGHWSICAIGGSPVDMRPGCKSIFFWDEDLIEAQMIAIITQSPISMKIINQMPFKLEVFENYRTIKQ